jgi:Zn-dependent protease with chaperone function
MGAVIPFVLAALAVLLVWVAPGLMARQRRFRRAPRAALVAWQAATLGGILAAVAVAPATLPLFLDDGEAATARPWWVLAALAVSGIVLGRVLWAGHDVGTRLRRMRGEQRQLVDIVAAHDRGGRVRVLQHPTPTAYCIPGRGSRVVLSQGVLDALPDDQLAAVVAHEEAHLRGRHDLLLEFFSVAHAAVPTRLRSEAAIAEVRLLIEALADRAAARRSGEVATARALVALADSRTPNAALGAGTTAPVRLRLLADGPAPPALSVGAYAYAVVAGTLPVLLLAAAWT